MIANKKIKKKKKKKSIIQTLLSYEEGIPLHTGQ